MTLKELRARKLITQLDLSLLTNISQTKLSLIERGYLKPNSNELLRLAKEFQVHPETMQFIERRDMRSVFE